ncbi:GntR family transcriptional regulator (plasmid) [Rhizobium sp. 32-5/1]|uniref:GntR family transcriptional regulator n=1 Tax=Rhizobium sp. 32-5/1 TaxID=3019602 RepID=UPI00240E2BE5|nr:GntR family transcriptional regulator [Rhizobium sp. 32-5/1]WEZ85923.1 GntR family transcriptional regulator [Rhizobium sp. 32-5/1]
MTIGGRVESGDARRGEIPLRQAAYERIEDLFKAGLLRPGEIVTQRALVEKTGATLGAIREAVPRLEAEGLLVTVPQRGLMVPSLDIGFVRDAYQLRRLIELAAVPTVIDRLPHSVVQELLDWHSNMRTRLVEADGPEGARIADEVQARDWSMHEGFVATMGNKLVINVFRVTAIKIRMAVQSRIQVTPYNALRVIEEHLAILEPLAARNVAAMSGALALHIDNSLKLALGEAINGSSGQAAMPEI